VAISDSSVICVKFEKIRILKIVWKWTLNGFEGDSFGQNDLKLCPFDYSSSRKCRDTSHVIYEKLTLKWTLLGFYGVLGGSKHSKTISIRFLIFSRVHRYITWYVSKIYPKMGILGLLGRLWLVMTKNQILLAHQELKPELLAKTRVKSIDPFSSYAANMIRKIVRKWETKMTQMAITPRRIVQSQICFRQFVRNQNILLWV
jgi:hypothetical protein